MGLSLSLVLLAVLSLPNPGSSQEIKDARLLVDEVGLEANIGLPYIVGAGVSYSLKLRNFPVYPSLALKAGVGAIVKVEGLVGLNYRMKTDLSYSLNIGHSGGNSFVFDTHAGRPNEFVGMAVNLQRKKYIGRSKYWCLSQLVGLDLKRHIDVSKTPEFYLYPYFEVGVFFMII